MKKEYTISDLFYTSWEELSLEKHAKVYTIFSMMENTAKDAPAYGYQLITLMRILRKRPLLVDKLNEAQVVDIFNDLAFLRKPWYYFPPIDGLRTPEEKLARHTFDHFIYADNEFSLFLITHDDKYLKRLAATLYQHPFDRESVDAIADSITCKTWMLELVMFTFANVRKFVMKRCKTLLPEPPRKEEKPEEQDPAPKPVPTGKMWLTLKHRLAETPAFQGFDTAGAANMYSTLDYLEDLAQMRANQK